MESVDIDYMKECFKSVGLVDVPEEMWEDFASRAEVVTLKRSTIEDKSTYICNKISFLRKGLIRMFYYKKDKEVTEGFVRPGRAFTSFESYFQQKNSIYFLEAEEDCVYYRMTYDDIEELCHKYREFDLFYQESMIKVILTLKLYIDILQSETADEKYDVFCREFSDVVLNVPSIHIASCLGITPETLSRVRSRRYKQ